MTNVTNQRIGELVVDALERTAFVLVDILDESEAAELPAPTKFVKIAFSGAANGHVVLAATPGFTVELASSILGVEAEEVDPDKEGVDALSELANIVGGSIILELGGENQYIKYGLPTPINSEAAKSVLQNSITCYLECDGDLLSVSWNSASEQAAAA